MEVEKKDNSYIEARKREGVRIARERNPFIEEFLEVATQKILKNTVLVLMVCIYELLRNSPSFCHQQAFAPQEDSDLTLSLIS